MSDVDDFLMGNTTFRDDLRTELIQAIIHHERNRPRSLQKALGPSEIGIPCPRKLAFKLADVPEKNYGGDVLPSLMGTAGHKVMESVMALQNTILGRERWLIENKVLAPVKGTFDLYDTDSDTVIDWKFPGATSFKKQVTEGPNIEYQEQVQIYGRGMEEKGYHPKNVAIMLIPRAGMLRQAHMWMTEYDRERADRVVARLHNIERVTQEFDIANHPERASFIPAVPTDSCKYCPWFTPGEEGTGMCCGFTGNPNGSGVQQI